MPPMVTAGDGRDLKVLLVCDDQAAEHAMLGWLSQMPGVQRVVPMRHPEEALYLLEAGFWPDVMVLLFDRDLGGFAFLRRTQHCTPYPIPSLLLLRPRDGLARPRRFRSGKALIANRPADIRAWHT